MRYFHKKGNLAFCPSLNLDKLWTLVGDDVRKAHASKTDVAPVIDVTKFVRASPPLRLIHLRAFSFAYAVQCSGLLGQPRAGEAVRFSYSYCAIATGILQGAGQGSASQPASHREGEIFLEAS